MAATRWVLYGQAEGRPVQEFARGSKKYVNETRRALTESAEQFDGRMPYPRRRFLVTPTSTPRPESIEEHSNA